MKKVLPVIFVLGLLGIGGYYFVAGKKAAPADARLAALRTRCVEVAKTLDNGEKRLAGLATKICGFSSLTWCRDAAKLERLLAVLGSIKEKETES